VAEFRGQRHRPVRASDERQRHSSAPPVMGEGSLDVASRRAPPVDDGFARRRSDATNRRRQRRRRRSTLRLGGRLRCATCGGVPALLRRREGEYERGSTGRSSWRHPLAPVANRTGERRTVGGTEMRRPARLAVTACCAGEERRRLEQPGHAGLEAATL
jgi:hypothetical protein